eukprot:11588617-Alexandrium_andersonii.AAC.1
MDALSDVYEHHFTQCEIRNSHSRYTDVFDAEIREARRILHLAHEGENDFWEAPTPGQLKAAARKCCGKAAGVDGWRAEELCSLPETVWRHLRGAMLLMEEEGS